MGIRGGQFWQSEPITYRFQKKTYASPQTPTSVIFVMFWSKKGRSKIPPETLNPTPKTPIFPNFPKVRKYNVLPYFRRATEVRKYLGLRKYFRTSVLPYKILPWVFRELPCTCTFCSCTTYCRAPTIEHLCHTRCRLYVVQYESTFVPSKVSNYLYTYFRTFVRKYFRTFVL